jgi:hypothetical protein
MALDDDTKLTTLAKAILTATAPWLAPGSDAFNASWPKTKEYVKQLMEYVADNAEVSTTLDVASPSDLTVVVAGAPVPVLGASIGSSPAAASATGTVA